MPSRNVQSGAGNQPESPNAVPIGIIGYASSFAHRKHEIKDWPEDDSVALTGRKRQMYKAAPKNDTGAEIQLPAAEVAQNEA